MNPTRRPDTAGASPWRPSLRPLRGGRACYGWAVLLLLLGWGSAAPARADLTVDGGNSPVTIHDNFDGTIFVNSGGVLNVADGAEISGGTGGVVVLGGTVSITGGTISPAASDGVIVYNGGTVSISGDATISAPRFGVDVQGGTMNIAGGSISGSTYGVYSGGGTATLSGGAFSGAVGAYVDTSGMMTISGGSFSGSNTGVYDFGGTVNISGSSTQITGSNSGVHVSYGGTVSIAGGSVSGGSDVGNSGVYVGTGTVNISGGSISSGSFGVSVLGSSSAANISGGSISAVVGVSIVGSAANITGGSISGDQGVQMNGGTLGISGGTISGTTPLSDGVQCSNGTINISGGTLSGYRGVDAGNGSTVNISSASISGVGAGIYVNGGTVNLSSGSISGVEKGVWINYGPASISGGTISAPTGVYNGGPGSLSIFGCNLQLVGDQLIGTLQDGSQINTPTFGVTAQNLANQDTGAPVITCPSNIDTQAASGQCNASVSLSTPTASDGCSTPPVVVGVRSDGQALAAPYPIGTTTITWTAVNAHGSASCDQTIHVAASGQNLTLTAPAPVTVNTDPGMCIASNVSLGSATASGNCSSVTVTNNAPSTFPKGITTVTWTATDAAGNTATADQTVTVNDVTKPTITCPGSLTVPATSASGAVVSYPAPTASDNCTGVTVSSTPASGATFPVGTTTVNCAATDASGNTATCSFTVTVQSQADVSVSQTASPSPVVTGSQLTYTLTVSNNGPQTAQGVLLTDAVPSGTTFVSATRSASVGTLTTPKGSNSTVSWNIGTLTSGQSVSLTLVVKVSAKAGSTLSNMARVSSSSPTDPNTANNSRTVSTPVVAKR